MGEFATDTTAQQWNVDVLVIGGGPAGTTAASILHMRGYRPLVVEKDRHPRFHIGESLLPRNMELFEKLGVVDELKRIGVDKRGAEFRDSDTSKRAWFNFARWQPVDAPVAFQVKREEFDLMMINAARAKGVDVLEGCTITDIEMPPGGVDGPPVSATALTDGGERHSISARFVIDASGRDTFLGSKLDLKSRNPKHNSAAIFNHFAGVPRLDGEEQGNISIYWFEHGWFWAIPLPNDCMSVGMVCWPKYMKTRTGSLETFLQQGIDACPALKARMKNARPLREVTATGNFSYSSRSIFGERFVLTGDAYAFIDPVFSSGVYLATKSGEFAAEAVATGLQKPAAMNGALKGYERKVHKGLKEFSWFIYRFTNPAMRSLFLNPTERCHILEAVTSILAGGVYEVPLRLRIGLKLFKAVYFVKALMMWRESAAYRKRLEGIEGVEG